VGIDGLADSAQVAAVRDLQAAIDEAIHTLPEGQSSGVCADCGKQIESARLKLLPGTNAVRGLRAEALQARRTGV
jgi:RNA polymerase-binding transcription factor DksA